MVCLAIISIKNCSFTLVALQHIGFYATPYTHEKFKQDLSIYKQGKGSVQFLHDKELLVKLISEMIKYKVAENDHFPTLNKRD